MSEQYPTPFAYATACKALWKHRERADRAEAEVRRLRAAVDDVLALHQECSIELCGQRDRMCHGCGHPHPCRTRREIEAALAPVADPDPHTTSKKESTP